MLVRNTEILIYPAIIWRVFFMFSSYLLSLTISVKSYLCFPATGIAKVDSKRKKNEHMQNKTAEKMKSLQHGVFPGGHPSKY